MASRYASWVLSENPRSTMWSQKRLRSTLLPSFSIRCLLKCLVPVYGGPDLRRHSIQERTDSLSHATNRGPHLRAAVTFNARLTCVTAGTQVSCPYQPKGHPRRAAPD